MCVYKREREKGRETEKEMERNRENKALGFMGEIYCPDRSYEPIVAKIVA